jgi:hypothetical protein
LGPSTKRFFYSTELYEHAVIYDHVVRKRFWGEIEKSVGFLLWNFELHFPRFFRNIPALVFMFFYSCIHVKF